MSLIHLLNTPFRVRPFDTWRRIAHARADPTHPTWPATCSNLSSPGWRSLDLTGITPPTQGRDYFQKHSAVRLGIIAAYKLTIQCLLRFWQSQAEMVRTLLCGTERALAQVTFRHVAKVTFKQAVAFLVE